MIHGVARQGKAWLLTQEGKMSDDLMTRRRQSLFEIIGEELEHAYEKHGAEPWGRHEFYAILKEEVDELWEAIKRDEPLENVYAELTQLAAMCFRYYETGDRYRWPMSRETTP